MEDKIVASLWVVAVLAFLVTLPWCISTHHFSSEITVFPINTIRPGVEVATDRMVFTVFPERQEVVWTVLGDQNQMSKLNKCVVRDKSNWTCSGAIIEHTMKDGNYTQSPVLFTHYTNGWKWWYTKITNKIFPDSKK